MSAYKKTGQYAKALEVLHKSLEYRLSLYGFYTFYAANAYSNLITALYEKAVNTDTDFDPVIYEYLENLRKILCFVAGEKSPRLFGYFTIMANICNRNGQIKKAAAYAAKALQFNTSRDEAQRKAMEQIIEKARHTEDGL